MKAWQYMGEQRPIQLNDIPEPTPGPTQVIIDMRAAGLCHSDLMYMETGDHVMPFLPMTQGHENAGVAPIPTGWFLRNRCPMASISPATNMPTFSLIPSITMLIRPRVTRCGLVCRWSPRLAASLRLESPRVSSMP